MFITMSFDGCLKFWNENAEIEHDAEYTGVEFLNGCIVPNK